jgi:hypothetical protein
MDEGQMNDPIGRPRTGPQAAEILEIAAMHLRPRVGQRRGRDIRASQPDDLVTCADKLTNYRRTNEAGRAGDKNSHEKPPTDQT